MLASRAAVGHGLPTLLTQTSNAGSACAYLGGSPISTRARTDRLRGPSAHNFESSHYLAVVVDLFFVVDDGHAVCDR